VTDIWPNHDSDDEAEALEKLLDSKMQPLPPGESAWEDDPEMPEWDDEDEDEEYEQYGLGLGEDDDEDWEDEWDPDDTLTDEMEDEEDEDESWRDEGWSYD